MPTLDATFLLYSPFSRHRETVFSTRYYWDNARRGNHPFVIIQKTLSGCGVFERGRVAQPVPEDHAFIAVVPEESVYYYPREATEPWALSWMNFYGDFASRLISSFRGTYGDVLPLPRKSKAGLLYERLSSGLETGADSFGNSAHCYQFLMEWARQLADPKLQEQSPVEVALNLCATRFREPLGVKELADATGLTREHFTRLFTAQMGCSPARYLRDLRTRAARELMEIGGLPAKEVALRCGFPSVRSLRMALA